MTLGKAIKLCRTQKDMAQSELAQRTDLSISYISLLERGKRDPTISTLETIAQALSLPLCLLIFLASDRNELPVLLAEKLSYTTWEILERKTA